MIKKRLYNKYKQLLQRKHSIELRQYKVEQHLKDNPTDYTSVICNERLKSDVSYVDYLIEEVVRRLEVVG